MVRVRVIGWVINYASKSTCKDRSTGVCVCLRETD